MVSIYLLVISQIEAYHAQQADDYLEPPTPRRRQRHNWLRIPILPFQNSLIRRRSAGGPSPHEVLDVDEILRKLHREGQESLSASRRKLF